MRDYRDGGRGRENVLTAEVFSPLAYLPRSAFLGEVLRTAHGATEARERAAAEIEQSEVTLLPDESRLPGTDIVVQPDAKLVMPGCHVLVEAKRIRSASFQAEQLAREYVTAVSDAGAKSPLLLLVLGSPPPVLVKRHGRLAPLDAVRIHLEGVVARTDGSVGTAEELSARLPEALAWITWAEIRDVVSTQVGFFADLPDGVNGTVLRLAAAVSTAIEWHS